ncbi:MAG: hypothetical protein RLN99_08200 [Kiloniellaceae bacterium]
MVCRKSQLVPYAAGALVVALLAWGTIVSAGDRYAGDGQIRYRPVQGIQQDFGSKSITGYFIRRDDQCQVALHVAEKSDPAFPAMQGAARVRLALAPGEIAWLDSEEGRTLSVTCGPRAASLIVNSGNQEQLDTRAGAMEPPDRAEGAAQHSLQR